MRRRGRSRESASGAHAGAPLRTTRLFSFAWPHFPEACGRAEVMCVTRGNTAVIAADERRRGAVEWSLLVTMRRVEARVLIEASPSMMGGLVKLDLVCGPSTDGRSMRTRKPLPSALVRGNHL